MNLEQGAMLSRLFLRQFVGILSVAACAVWPCRCACAVTIISNLNGNDNTQTYFGLDGGAGGDRIVIAALGIFNARRR
jgi:hypothetical protein